jgi:hypothetical protein
MVLKKSLNNKRKMNKKGIFFTLLTIAILALFLITYSISNVAKQRESLKNRVETLNNFVFSVQDDLQRKMYISGYRAILCYEKYLTNSDKDKFIIDTNASFTELFFEGELYDIPQELMVGATPLEGGATYEYIEKEIKERGDKSNIGIEFNKAQTSVKMTQDDPWNVKVTLTTNLSIKDKGGLAEWNKILIVSAYIPIENFNDPIYYKNTNNYLNPKFIRNPNFSVEGSSTDVINNITYQINNQLYISHTNAPSFLDRFEGDLESSSPNGIESFVGNVITRKTDRSSVDYIYFRDGASSYCPIGGFEWLKLDCIGLSNAAFYKVSCSSLCS